MPVDKLVSNAKANTTSLRAWGQGCLQAAIYGVSSSFLSALGVNGTASFNLMEIEPLSLTQLGYICGAGAAVKLAQFMLANPLFPSNS